MSEPRDHEARSWTQEESDGDRAIAELRKSLDRLRGQVGVYRERVGEAGEAEEQPKA